MKPKAEIAWVHLPLREDRPSGRSARDEGCLKKHKRKMGGGNEVDACHWRWTKCNGQKQARELMTKGVMKRKLT